VFFFLPQASTKAPAAAAAPAKFRATIFPGDGIGPEISKSVQTIFQVRGGHLLAVPREAANTRAKNTRLVLSQPQVAPLSRSFPTPPPQAAKVPIEWEQHTISTHAVTKSGDLISEEALESVIRNKVGLKGALSRLRPPPLPHPPQFRIAPVPPLRV
jgi:isocitrate/isopropylmalate dehydrogenase